MAIDAEIKISPLLTTRSKLGTGRKSEALKSRERRRKTNFARTTESAQVGKGEKLDLSKLDQALVVLLNRLPTPGVVWEAKEKAKFIRAFEALLDVVYPSEIKGAGSEQDTGKTN